MGCILQVRVIVAIVSKKDYKTGVPGSAPFTVLDAAQIASDSTDHVNP